MHLVKSTPSSYPEISVALTPVEWELLLRLLAQIGTGQDKVGGRPMEILLTHENVGPLHQLLQASGHPVSLEWLSQAQRIGQLHTVDSAVVTGLVRRLMDQIPA